MQDTNDIPFNSYSIDFFGAIGRTFSHSGNESFTFFADLYNTLVILWGIFTALSFLLSALFLFGIIYALIRANQLGEAEDEFIASAERSYEQLYGSRTKNWRWDEVLAHIGSDRPNDWKLAVIDADVMLYETLESAGYAGTSIGEMLKSASPKSFRTLDNAWNAHKIRNQVAHSGTDFVLTKKIAQETITQYKMVFEEFGVV